MTLVSCRPLRGGRSDTVEWFLVSFQLGGEVRHVHVPVSRAEYPETHHRLLAAVEMGNREVAAQRTTPGAAPA
ncbi:hypothetical protein [Desulfohalovibrio reitneri]|uniref:hypothetical protein n=1 Tax=Desulfohalovibrio reitneri TaxID=1307759 RepID=UPI0004A77208|nr:hypothetical protein [Desulfohalovibrio reitneri]